MKDFHESHCVSCYKSDCSSQQCPVIPCPLGCPASFHECKYEDHSRICSQARRPCINAAYGCPFMLKNGDVAQHLQYCPASTVICTMEWGRIPLGHAQPVPFTSEKNVFQSSSDVTYKHLDQELALRDQRVMFENAYSESVFKTLVADLTAEEQAECYKAVTKNDTGSGNSSASSSLSSSPTTSDSEENGSKIVFRPILPAVKPAARLQNEFRGLGRLQGVSSLGLYRFVSTASVGTSTEDLDVTHNSKFLYPQAVIKGKWDLTSQLFELMRSEANMRCHSICQTDTNEYYRRHIATQTIPLHLISIDINHLKQAIVEKSVDCCRSVNFKSLILKDVVECSSLPHNRHRVTDQRLMFLCNQVFQRNEYCWHFQNAHCDFYSSLNGWIEETCPYKQYGCSFTQHRLVPHDTRHRIAFDRVSSCMTTKQLELNPNDLKSGGDPSIFHTSDHALDEANLLDMPVEIMLKILGYLDSYSIKQMMLTCAYLYDFSLSLLKTNGIVQAKWVRGAKLQGLQTWKIKKFSWSFSNAISPIKKWQINSVPGMAAHLTTCPFVPRNSLDYYMKDKIAICPFQMKGKMEDSSCSKTTIRHLGKTDTALENLY